MGPPIRWTWRLGLEALLGMGLLVAAGGAVVGGWLPLLGIPLLCVPALVWVTLRLGRRGAATAVVTLGAVVAWSAVAGYGPFEAQHAGRALLWLQLYMIGLAAMALSVAAAVAERRRAEPERLSEIAARDGAHARLRGEAKFRALLESAPDATVIADREGRIVLVNSQTEKVFGYGRDELIGERVEILMPQQLRQRHEQHRERYVAELRPRAMGGQGLLGRRRDGAEFPVEISLSPIQTEEGVLISSAIRDVSERRRGE
ncbi:MAG: PAS domain S-box protein [Candidatus Rokubacteria bacterium]|nr:PAS domain S-box protein [Candidatus Rokubacteria bacterium]